MDTIKQPAFTKHPNFHSFTSSFHKVEGLMPQEVVAYICIKYGVRSEQDLDKKPRIHCIVRLACAFINRLHLELFGFNLVADNLSISFDEELFRFVDEFEKKNISIPLLEEAFRVLSFLSEKGLIYFTEYQKHIGITEVFSLLHTACKETDESGNFFIITPLGTNKVSFEVTQKTEKLIKEKDHE